MECPSCREPLVAEHHGLFEDILVRRCPQCRRVWVSAQALDRLDDNISVDASKIEWEERELVDAMDCPACVGTYRTQSPRLIPVHIPSHPEVVGHRCLRCGSFLLSDEAIEGIRGLIAGRAVPAGT